MNGLLQSRFNHNTFFRCSDKINWGNTLKHYNPIDLNLNYNLTGMAFSKSDANRPWHDTDGRNFAN